MASLRDPRFLLILGLIIAAAVMRLIPHPPNFVPLAAMALFSGAYLPDRRLALIIPLAALFVTDLLLGLHATMAFVYLGFVLTVAIGFLLRRRRGLLRVGAAVLASATVFFLLTNFGTWLVGGLYPLTGAGLAACYIAAIPFFQTSLLADLFYSALLFGGMAVVERKSPRLGQGRMAT